jgi:hypothetical protein
LCAGQRLEAFVIESLQEAVLPTKPAVDLHGRAAGRVSHATDRESRQSAVPKDLPGRQEQRSSCLIRRFPRQSCWWLSSAPHWFHNGVILAFITAL